MDFSFIRRALYKFSVAVTCAWIIALLPSPADSVSVQVKNGIVGITCVLYIGKLLYDSLYYDRYPH
ncbi:MAG: hypothetical protein ABJA67_07085 [Chthonomonadales bacterium]